MQNIDAAISLNISSVNRKNTVPFRLQKSKNGVVDVAHSVPYINPCPFDTLVVAAFTAYSTSSVSTAKDVHDSTDIIVFDTLVHSDTGGKPLNKRIINGVILAEYNSKNKIWLCIFIHVTRN